jgi:type III restriction enzyme
MATSFFGKPILNSPYAPPLWHHPLDAKGQPQGLPPINRRRPSAEITPIVPQAKKRRPGEENDATDLFDDTTARDRHGRKYDVHGLVNEIRGHMESWRSLRNPTDRQVTPATARLLTHCHSYNFQNQRPFFCQIEAAETLIWLTEVARNSKGGKLKGIWEQLQSRLQS